MLDEADLLIEYNKDLSRAEAEKIVEKNKITMEDAHLQAMKTNKPEETVVEEYKDEQE